MLVRTQPDSGIKSESSETANFIEKLDRSDLRAHYLSAKMELEGLKENNNNNILPNFSDGKVTVFIRFFLHIHI